MNRVKSVHDTGFTLAVPPNERQFYRTVAKEVAGIRHRGLAALLPTLPDRIDAALVGDRRHRSRSSALGHSTGTKTDLAYCDSIDRTPMSWDNSHAAQSPAQMTSTNSNLGGMRVSLAGCVLPAMSDNAAKTSTPTGDGSLAPLGALKHAAASTIRPMGVTIAPNPIAREPFQTVPRYLAPSPNEPMAQSASHLRATGGTDQFGASRFGQGSRPKISAAGMTMDGRQTHERMNGPTSTRNNSTPPSYAAAGAAPVGLGHAYAPDVARFSKHADRVPGSAAQMSEPVFSRTGKDDYGHELFSASPIPARDRLDERRADSAIQGDVYLDGSLLGKWVARNLAREAERPSAGGSAFDSRRNVLPTGRMIGM